MYFNFLSFMSIIHCSKENEEIEANKPFTSSEEDSSLVSESEIVTTFLTSIDELMPVNQQTERLKDIIKSSEVGVRPEPFKLSKDKILTDYIRCHLFERYYENSFPMTSPYNYYERKAVELGVRSAPVELITQEMKYICRISGSKETNSEGKENNWKAYENALINGFFAAQKFNKDFSNPYNDKGLFDNESQMENIEESVYNYGYRLGFGSPFFYLMGLKIGVEIGHEKPLQFVIEKVKKFLCERLSKNMEFSSHAVIIILEGLKNGYDLRRMLPENNNEFKESFLKFLNSLSVSDDLEILISEINEQLINSLSNQLKEEN